MNVFIDGDKNAFSSKTAINRFKEHIKKNIIFDLDDLQRRFIHYNYKLELIEKKDDNIRFNIYQHSNDDLNKINNKKILKTKINDLKLSRSRIEDNDITNVYNKLKNINSNVPLPSPEDIKNNPEKYKPIIAMLTTTLNKKLGSNNNYIKYFKLLNDHINQLSPPNQENNIIENITSNLQHEHEKNDISCSLIENITGNNIINHDTDTDSENEYIIT